MRGICLKLLGAYADLQRVLRECFIPSDSSGSGGLPVHVGCLSAPESFVIIDVSDKSKLRCKLQTSRPYRQEPSDSDQFKRNRQISSQFFGPL